MTRKGTLQRRGRRAGQAVVEFALILPVFALLVFAAVEFGRAYYDLHLLTTAAREGARTGSLSGKVESDVQDSVSDFLTGAGLSGSWTTTTAVTQPDGSARAGGLVNAQEADRVAVTVQYSFQVLTGRIIPGFSGTIPLNQQCVYRHE
jgi:Flp pilus assembly protein TadG